MSGGVFSIFLGAVFVLAALAPMLTRVLRGAAGWVFAVVPGGLFVWLIGVLMGLQGGEPRVEVVPWVPSLGLELGFRLDGLSVLYLLLVSGIGVLISIYAGGYLHGHPQLGRFYGYLFFFMGAMLGVVSSENLLGMFVFWELTSLASYLLIGFNHESAGSRAAALQALLVTFAGGQCLLLGIVMLGWMGGGLGIGEIVAQAEALRGHWLFPAVMVLVLLGAFSKSAQVPLHFWLPGAMAAPTPVSAYLHSATMVTVGVFLLARLNPLFGGVSWWNEVLMGFGLATMVAGSVLAVGQTDLKRLLAYTTVGALGTMVLLLGIGTELAVQAAVAFLLVHSLYKGGLFMVAGTVDHETHTRDVRDLGGLARHMPVTAVAAGLAALAMCGVPPVLGFISKELIYEAKLELGALGWAMALVGVGANALVVAVALIVGVRPFLSSHKPTPKHPHEAPVALWLGPVLLAGLGVVLGLVPWLVDKPLVAPAVNAVLGEEAKVKLSLWHGLTPMLALSVATLGLGIVFYKMRAVLRRWREVLHPVSEAAGPEAMYKFLVYSVLPTVAKWQTEVLQHGYLRYYIAVIMGFTVVAVGLVFWRVEPPEGWLVWREFQWHEAVICVAMVAAGLAVLLTNKRLTAVGLLGVVGYGVAIIFALHGAPDLAITQFLVETLTLILFVLVIYHLPRGKSLSSVRARWRDGLVSAVLGVLVTLLIMKALSHDPAKEVARYFLENSLTAKGQNVVNVILVDFRALDTLGEAVVLALAGLGVAAVLLYGRQRIEVGGKMVGEAPETGKVGENVKRV